jgi:hypothetical protein
MEVCHMRSSSRSLIAVAAVAAAVLALAAVAIAANIHLKSGPSFTDNGTTLTATGELAGLGTGPTTVDITTRGNPTAVCVNRGQHQPPGQQPAPVTQNGSVAIPPSQIKHGSAPFRVTTDAPTSPIPGAPDCPSVQWTEKITNIAFTSATLTFSQGADSATVTCTFSPPTSDGAVPSSNVTCQ